jgi:hypothetical protein
MFIFVIQTLQKKWNKIRMKQLASGKHMKNDYFPRTLKFEMMFTAKKYACGVALVASLLNSIFLAIQKTYTGPQPNSFASAFLQISTPKIP